MKVIKAMLLNKPNKICKSPCIVIINQVFYSSFILGQSPFKIGEVVIFNEHDMVMRFPQKNDNNDVVYVEIKVHNHMVKILTEDEVKTCEVLDS